ncbi:phosphotransferase enzyme family protein [Xylogone sp. PMI_703]|nr:phosphotransferase enzyme family protein [Xylogone sp. PMI_703]
MQFPYFAPPECLPSALPTREAIANSGDVLSEYAGRRIVRIGCHFVVKYGTSVKLLEGENMLFVVPQVYAIYSDNQNGANYIVMENIEGDALISRWGSMSTSQKEKVCIQLKHFCDELRSIPSLGYYGSLGERGLEDPVFWMGNEAPSGSINGLFKSEDELNNAMIQKYIYNNLPIQKAEFYRHAFPVVLRNHQPVAGDRYSLVVIDWEFAGWYPSYWEFTNAMFSCGRWNDDWPIWILKILDPFFQEYSWMQILYNKLWS